MRGNTKWNEKLATSELDNDVKISVVLREAPTKLREQFRLVNSHQIRSTTTTQAAMQSSKRT